MQVKLREIMHSKKQVVYGLTVPNQVAVFFKECFFSIEKSGCAIVFTSGASIVPTDEQIKNYKFEGAIVK